MNNTIAQIGLALGAGLVLGYSPAYIKHLVKIVATSRGRRQRRSYATMKVGTYIFVIGLTHASAYILTAKLIESDRFPAYGMWLVVIGLALTAIWTWLRYLRRNQDTKIWYSYRPELLIVTTGLALLVGSSIWLVSLYILTLVLPLLLVTLSVARGINLAQVLHWSHDVEINATVVQALTMIVIAAQIIVAQLGDKL